jgi:hypothetical protein
MPIVIRRLEEHDAVENFDCGDEVPIEGAAENGPQRMYLDMRTVRAALPH